MSRAISENGNHIWKYRPGQTQNLAYIGLWHTIGEYRIMYLDEDCEIQECTSEEFFDDMGKNIEDAYSDVLKIKHTEVNELRNLLNGLKDIVKYEIAVFNQKFKGTDKYVSYEILDADIHFISENCPNIWLYKMVENMLDYIDSNPRMEYFFMGE